MNKRMIALMIAGAFAVGCGSKEAGSGSGAVASDSIGVPECDDYVKKAQACMDKNPEYKKAMEVGLKQTVESWKMAASKGGAAKEGLKQSCSAAMVAMSPDCK